MTRFGFLIFAWALGLAATDLFSYSPAEKFRRPVDLAWTNDGLLAVANRDVGSISLVDLVKGEVVGEAIVGKRLTSLASLHDGRFLAATDEETNELLLLEPKGVRVEVRARLAVPLAPVKVLVAEDDSFLTVTSLWARQVSLIQVELTQPELSLARVTDLPFPPRLQWMDAAGRKLVVTDAFSDQVATIGLPDLRLVSTHTLPGHNLGGIALSPDGMDLLFSHQVLNPYVPTTRSRVFWGSVMQNGLTGVAIRDLFDSSRPNRSPFARRKHYPVGQNGKGAGEPGPMLVTKDGSLILGIRGTGEVAIGESLNHEWTRIQVGKRPVAGILDATEKHACFVDLYGDAVVVIEVANGVLAATIPLGPPTKPGLLQLGETLFHDSRLSLDGWYSCNSCHTDGHTSGMLNDNLDDLSFGTPKRIPSLLGTAETGPWTWNGLQGSLTLQVRQSLSTTLLNEERKHGKATQLDQEALVAYLFTLPLPPPLSEAREERPSDEITRGKLLFGKLGCNECHRGPLLTSPDEYDVGIYDEAGQRKFNPPTLHGVSQRNHFFHDGSASSLREVLDTAGHPDGGGLTQRQLGRLIAYLRTL